MRRGSLNSTILLNDQTMLSESYLKPIHWRDMSSQLREFERFSRYSFVGARWKFGQSSYSFYSRSLWSFCDKVVSIQVNSLQIEVVSRHRRSRFDTCRKSIRFNSIFRGRGRGGSNPSRNFQIWIKFRYKSGILLTEMDSCQWKLQFPSIVDHNKIMCCCNSVQFWIV